MAVVHRALFTWFLILVFLILLVLRLDGKTLWNWFIVFIPMWMFDSIMLIYVILKIITHCRNGHDSWWLTMNRKLWCLGGVFLKIAFQASLCAKLEYHHGLALYYVFIPLWIILIGVFVDVLRDLKVFDSDQWRREAEAVIRDIESGVKEATSAKKLRCSDSCIYLNITTIEDGRYCVELTTRGFRVVGRDYDCDAHPEATWFETPYALMDHPSAAFRQQFGNALIAKLSAMQTLVDNGDSCRGRASGGGGGGGGTGFTDKGT